MVSLIPQLFGHKSEALFDLWSIQHFLAGILLGALVAYLLTKQKSFFSWKNFVLIILICALSWELTELAMETGWFGPAIAHWKNGLEHWSNRLVGDPLLVLSGSLIARQFPSIWKIALVPATIWLILNVTAPTSMAVQQFLFQSVINSPTNENFSHRN